MTTEEGRGETDDRTTGDRGPRTDRPTAVFGRPSSVALVGILLPFVVAIALCAFASIWPLRLDARALQDLSKVESLGLPQSSGEFIFLSRDNSVESARTATFGLRQLAFPNGTVFWAALKAQCIGPWLGGFAAIDQAGNAFLISGGADGEWQWAPAHELANEARSRSATSFVVYDSYQTRALFEQRWPFLKASSKVAVLTDGLVMRRIPFDRDAIPLAPGEARAMLADAGFTMIGTRYRFYFPKMLSALRPLERFAERMPLGAQYCVLARKPANL
ncbi:MAG: hypothetical protein AABO57_05765 [Acidobacteriota bacterium]